MKPKVWGDKYRSTTVCIDSYRNGVLTGRFYNPHLDSGRSFESLSQFLLGMDEMMDAMQLPQAFSEKRTFSKGPKEPAKPRDLEIQQGTMATFMVKVLFRQNASWQGSVVWLEDGREEPFRSVLELIYLMDSALQYSGGS